MPQVNEFPWMNLFMKINILIFLLCVSLSFMFLNYLNMKMIFICKPKNFVMLI